MTAPKPRATPGRPAWPELRALAAAARDRMAEGDPANDGLGDWDPGDVADAITAVETAGWPFRRALAEVARMLADTDVLDAVGETRPLLAVHGPSWRSMCSQSGSKASCM